LRPNDNHEEELFDVVGAFKITMAKMIASRITQFVFHERVREAKMTVGLDKCFWETERIEFACLPW
jgi:hypothetical protein